MPVAPASPWPPVSAWSRSWRSPGAWSARVRWSRPDSCVSRTRLTGGFYVSQLSKYLPAGGLLQAASQVNLAAASRLAARTGGRRLSRVGPLLRRRRRCPRCRLGLRQPPPDLGAGALGLRGSQAVALLWRRIMAAALAVARRLVHRIPAIDRLPSKTRSCGASHGRSCGLALVLRSVHRARADPWLMRSARASPSPRMPSAGSLASWLCPSQRGSGSGSSSWWLSCPMSVQVRCVAASLALRLIAIATEVIAIGTNRAVYRRLRRSEPASSSPETVAT